MKRRATLKDLLTPVARLPIEVDLPGTDLSVTVRRLTAEQQAACLSGVFSAHGITDFGELQARQMAAALIDPTLSVHEAREMMSCWSPDVVVAITNIATGQGEEEE